MVSGESTSENPQWFYRIAGPFCSTLFLYNGKGTTHIYHTTVNESGTTWSLNEMDVATKPIYTWEQFIEECEEYVIENKVR